MKLPKSSLLFCCFSLSEQQNKTREQNQGSGLRVGDIGNISPSKPHVEIVNAYDQVAANRGVRVVWN